MIEEGFRDYLRKQGKKHHVVQGLVHSVKLFENYLKKQDKEIRLTTQEDLLDYAASCESEKKDSARIRIRGAALYFGYIGNNEMAAIANGIRQAGISKHRSLFRLKDFLGVNQAHISQLKTVGITDIAQMIENGKTPDARKKLARGTGMTVEDILELVKLADLARITGVKSIRARLYHDAGLDTLDKIALLDAAMLRKICTRFVTATCFPGVPPTLKEAAHTVTSAKALPRIVEW
jgi:hypothetical protein